MYLGELISLLTAISWTATAMFAEAASKRMGSLSLNVIRMLLSLVMLSLTLWLTMGSPYPIMADSQTWFWLCLSGFVGYVLGDYCLFQGYVLMGSRFGQLLMTLSSPAAAITAWFLLGESMSPLAILGMIITMSGIAMSVLSKGNDGTKVQLKLPPKGLLFGIAAGVGQGVGLVLSKVGMEHYSASIAALGITDLNTFVVSNAIIPIPLGTMMPFASTMIRAVIGMIGFSVALMLLSHNGTRRLLHAISDRKAMLCAFLAAIFGPFIGVSLSLMATLYTSAGIAQTIMALTPVLIIAPAYIFFHQRIKWIEVLGACISVIGVSLFFI